jgi:hypothetical protein
MLFGSLLQRTNELGFVAHIGHDGLGTAACRLDLATTSSRGCLRRPQITTVAPSCAKRSAVAAPIPEPPPDTNAIFPSRRLLMLVSP